MSGFEKKVQIRICMGSSCFSRGNNHTLKKLKEYVIANNLENHVEMSGSLCDGLCNSGPHVIIEGKRYEGISPESVIDLLG